MAIKLSGEVSLTGKMSVQYILSDPHFDNVVTLLNFENMNDGTAPFVKDVIPGTAWNSRRDISITGGVLTGSPATNGRMTWEEGQTVRSMFNGRSTQQWTIEFKLKINTVTEGSWQPAFIWRSISDSTMGILMSQPTTGTNTFRVSGGDTSAGYEFDITSVDTFTAAQDVEIALTRNGDDYYLHMDGVYQGKDTTSVLLDLGADGIELLGDTTSTTYSSNGMYRLRMTHDVARYAEGVNYSPEPGNSYVVARDEWVADTELVNGGFETNTTTGWTIDLGSPYVNGPTSEFAQGSNYLRGGPSDKLCTIHQDITVPVGAQLVQFNGVPGSGYTDYDQGACQLTFLDSGDSEIVGSGTWHTSYGSSQKIYPFASIAEVPPTATKARISGRLSREQAGSSNNGGVDAFSVNWKTSGTPWTFGSDLMVNGGFETGDFTGWTNISGTGAIGTDAAYVAEGTYAAWGGTTSGYTYEQEFAVDPAAKYGYVTAWLSGASAGQDEVMLKLHWRGGSATSTVTYYGPYSQSYKAFASMMERVPTDATTVAVQFQFVRRKGTSLDAGIDAVTFKWVY